MSTDQTSSGAANTPDVIPEKKEVSEKEAVLEQLKREDHIQSMRERLYSRGATSAPIARHALPRHEIHDTMEAPQRLPEREKTVEFVDQAKITTIDKSNTPASVVSDTLLTTGNESMKTVKTRSYRTMILLGGIGFFLVALIVSSLFMLRGDKSISGENITMEVSGPLTVGGGEEMSFQVSIANQNAIAIQSATLIVDYPSGTQSPNEEGKSLTTERQQLNTIANGEMVNVPFKARMYGEENEEKQIQVRIEYRVEGSNATFEKKADPLAFKISTSPVVINYNTVKTISSGQEVELTLTVQSNSPTPLSNILVKAKYPEGFDYTKSTPETSAGQDTWRFDTLKSNEKKTIKIKGLITGLENDVRKFDATAGVASDTDSNALVSELSTAHVEIAVEKPSLDVGVTINSHSDETVIIKGDQNARVNVVFKNTLNTSIYDGKVNVALSGNALNEFQVIATNGFYDSSKNTIKWDGVDMESLKTISPGGSSAVSFMLNPVDSVGHTPEITLKVSVVGKRAISDQNTEELGDNVIRTIRVESVPVVIANVVHNSGPFTNTGPIPPVAEKVTQYTYILKARATKNDLTGAELVAILPTYVSWLDLVTAGNDVTYNATTRTMKWNIGDIEANSEKEVAIQVSLLPSLTQVRSSPTLLETQRFKATDRFTGTVVRTEHEAITTDLSQSGDGSSSDGVVQASE